ncbi:MAG: chromate resistance protein [Labilithrix sp.]|nr:chromate resistance protein [Labilithrix sp.]MCW5811651.1 chromate resistance protein [Labilithrix sp.]
MKPSRWLLLIHQIPPSPVYFRARVGRRLARLGAVAIKNAVYALPAGDAAREGLRGLAREIAEDGGEATVCEAVLVEGLSDRDVKALFVAAREKDYLAIAQEARQAASKRGVDAAAELARQRKRLAEIVALDHFGAPGRAEAEASLRLLAERVAPDDHPDVRTARPAGKVRLSDYQRKTWVTRKGIHVDRIACAWLVRRFIDPKARFRFVSPDGFRAKPNEVSFDMADADFTHVGDRCSFETFVRRFDLRVPGLNAIAEIIHDLDLKDAKFGRVEAAGVGALLAGIAAAHPRDEDRIEAGSAQLDALLAGFARSRA